MNSPEEALEDLRFLRSIVERTRLRGADAGPYFLLWGSVWLLAASLTSPVLGLPPGTTWLSLVAVGWICSGFLAIRQRRRLAASRRRVPYLLKLWFWSLAILLLFSTALLVLTGTSDGVTVASPSFWAVLMGAWYAIGGFFLGMDVLVLGLLLVAIGLLSKVIGFPVAMANFVAGMAGGFVMLASGGLLLLTRKHHG